MISWIKNIIKFKSRQKSDFEIAFSSLKDFAKMNVKGAKRTYELLKELDEFSSKDYAEELINELKKINYASNTNSVFYFYFPIVSHILHFKPEYEKDILGIIVGPNFANGDTELDEMIKVIQGAMKYKQKENPKFLTKQGQNWVVNKLPELRNEVQREIQKCLNELNM
jgi:hypothetical protein